MPLLRAPLFGLAMLALAGVASACPYSVRDAGFIVREAKPFRLVVFVGDDEATNTLREQATAVSDTVLARSTVRLEIAAPGDEEHAADFAAREEYAERENVDAPGAMLFSPDDRSLGLDFKAAGADLAQLARSVVQSPTMDAILDGTIQRWCTLLFAPGADDGENADALMTAQDAAEAMKGFKPEMGAKVSEAPPVISLPGQDAARILWWSLGFDDCGTDRAKVAIIFGRGRRLGAILWGATLSERNIRNGMELLGRNCTCTSEPSQILGPVMPVVWTEDLQALVREKLGFDPDAPVAMSALSGVWTNFREEQTGPPGEYIPDPGAGYIELPFSDEPAPENAAGAEGAVPGAPQTSSPATGLEQRSMRAAIIAVAIVAILVIGGSIALLVRQRGRL